MAVLERSDGDYSSIRASVLTPGGACVATAATLRSRREMQSGARVAMDDAGDALAIWRWYDGLNWIVASSFRQAGYDWQRVREVSVSGFSAGPTRTGDERLRASGGNLAGDVGHMDGAVRLNGRGLGGAGWTPRGRAGLGPASASVPQATRRRSGARVGRSTDRSERARLISGIAARKSIASSTPTSVTPPTSPALSSGIPESAFAVWLESRDEHEVVASAAYDNTTPPETTDQSSNDELNTDSLADAAGTGVVVERASPLLAGTRIRVTVRCAARAPVPRSPGSCDARPGCMPSQAGPCVSCPGRDRRCCSFV